MCLNLQARPRTQPFDSEPSFLSRASPKPAALVQGFGFDVKAVVLFVPAFRRLRSRIVKARGRRRRLAGGRRGHLSAFRLEGRSRPLESVAASPASFGPRGWVVATCSPPLWRGLA